MGICIGMHSRERFAALLALAGVHSRFYRFRGKSMGVSLFTIGGTRQVVVQVGSYPLTVFYGEIENVARGYNVVMTGGRRWYMARLPAA